MGGGSAPEVLNFQIIYSFRKNDDLLNDLLIDFLIYLKICGRAQRAESYLVSREAPREARISIHQMIVTYFVISYTIYNIISGHMTVLRQELDCF